VIFLLKYHQNPKGTEHRKKRERKHIEKREKKRKIEKEMFQESSNKGEVNILKGEKHFNFKIFFFM
jgi:hypothetical protein